MTITLGDIKKICKEKGIAFRAGSLFGVSKNDSGKCDCFIDTADKSYAVKIISVGADARYVYFNNIGGGYISVKGVHGTEDFRLKYGFTNSHVPSVLALSITMISNSL